MKFYGLNGCVVTLFFAILQKTHQFQPCYELQPNILPVSEEEPRLDDEYINIRLISQITELDCEVCLLAAWNSELCGPIRFKGSVLSENREPRRIDIYTYNKDSSKHWVTRAMTTRVLDNEHVYKMSFIDVAEWKEEQGKYEQISLVLHIENRLNAYFAIVKTDEARMNYAIKICLNNPIHVKYQTYYYRKAGFILARNSVTEESYNNFKNDVEQQFTNLFDAVKTEVPLRIED